MGDREVYQMAGQLQQRIEDARKSIDPLDDTSSELSDMIKDNISIRSTTSSVNGRFRIRPNPNNNKPSQQSQGGGGRTIKSFFRGKGEKKNVSEYEDTEGVDIQSAKSSTTVSSVFSKFKIMDLYKGQSDNGEQKTRLGDNTEEFVPAVISASLNAQSDEVATTRASNISNLTGSSGGRGSGIGINDLNASVNEDIIQVTRSDSKESIRSTASTWSNFGINSLHASIGGGGVGDDQLEDVSETGSVKSKSSMRSMISGSSLSKMKKKMVKYFIKDSRDNQNVFAKRRDSDISIDSNISTDTFNTYQAYNAQQEESVGTLMALGFNRDAALTALTVSGNNVDAAADWLLRDLENASQAPSTRPERVHGGSSCSEDSQQQYLRPRGGPPSW